MSRISFILLFSVTLLLFVIIFAVGMHDDLLGYFSVWLVLFVCTFCTIYVVCKLLCFVFFRSDFWRIRFDGLFALDVLVVSTFGSTVCFSGCWDWILHDWGFYLKHFRRICKRCFLYRIIDGEWVDLLLVSACAHVTYNCGLNCTACICCALSSHIFWFLCLFWLSSSNILLALHTLLFCSIC